jgi:ABC-type Fe3+ transport system permease subunit
MMILVAPLAVALVAFIAYALDRKSKGEPILWETAGKLCLFGGLVTSGVVFATGPEAMVDAVKTVTDSVPSVAAVQDMFVGLPTF